MGSIDRSRIQELLGRERHTYVSKRPASAPAAATHLFGGVPMTWMNKWAGGFPPQLERAFDAAVAELSGP